MRKNPTGVMLSAAKHLAFSVTCEDEILRLSPQDDIPTQLLRVNGLAQGISTLPLVLCDLARMRIYEERHERIPGK